MHPPFRFPGHLPKQEHMNNAIVTGGLGFIGSHIARRLLAHGLADRVVLLDHYGSYIKPTRADWTDYRALRVRGIEDRVVIERAQTSYPNVMGHILRKHRPRHIFHLASLPLASLDNINAQEAIEGSILSTAYLFELCHHMREQDGYCPERIVYTSSSMVYGDFQYSPADEDHPTRPATVYGATKLAGEEVALGLSRTYGIPATVIRPSAVYGPTDMNRRVTQIFVENALRGRPLVVRGADEKLDFTHVDDAAKGFVLAGTRPEGAGQVFNITSGHAHTLLEYAEILRGMFPGLSVRVEPRDETRPRRGTLDISRARELLGYAPDRDLAEGVADYVAFVRAHGSVVK